MLTKKYFTHTPRMGWMLVVLIIISMLVLTGCGPAKQAKTYKVGVLSGVSAFAPLADGFKSKMTELGYIEGQNISYDVQTTEVDIAAYQRITQKFVADKVDLILAFPTEAAMEAKAATQGSNIPMVFAMAFTDVSGVDLIKSIREPGGNITGVRFPSVEIANKRMQILLEMVPNAKKILVPYFKDYPNVPNQLEVLRVQAKSLGIEIVECSAASPQELQTKLDGIGKSGADAILMIAEPLTITPSFYAILGNFAYTYQIPIGGTLMDAEGIHGSMFGLVPDATTAGEQAALLVDKIFKGTVAGTIPVITSESDFQIDYKAAQALKVTVPEGLLKQADKIIR
jgi:putative ABC transport system substrate-binding protein